MRTFLLDEIRSADVWYTTGVNASMTNATHPSYPRLLHAVSAILHLVEKSLYGSNDSEETATRYTVG